MREGQRQANGEFPLNKAAVSTRRVVSIWLPHLAIERWMKLDSARSDDRVALVEEGSHGQLVAAVTPAAVAAGARPGMRLTDARALDPGLIAVAADGPGDQALARLRHVPTT